MISVMSKNVFRPSQYVKYVSNLTRYLHGLLKTAIYGMTFKITIQLKKCPPKAA